MDARNLIQAPSPNIIDEEDDYIYHDVDDEYSPLSHPEVIQTLSPNLKAVPKDEGEGEGEGEDEGEGEGERKDEGEDEDEF